MTQHDPKLYNAILGEIQKLVSERKYTQSQIGEALGIKQAAVSNLLAGRSKLTLEQYLILMKLVGEKSHRVLQQAEAKLTQQAPMPENVENILYKSSWHLVLYCAATLPITVDDVPMELLAQRKTQLILDELTSVGLLEKKRNKYVQHKPETVYVPQNPLRSTFCHKQVIEHTWKLFEQNYYNRSYRQRRFLFYSVDRFTTAQIKEVESILWKAYDRVSAFQRENMEREYNLGEPMSLWNMHFMMGTPLEK